MAYSPYVPSNTTPAADPTIDFYNPLSYHQVRNTTFEYLKPIYAVIHNSIEYSFSFIVSSPLAQFFLSTFNFFNLSSIYILLNIRVPYDIFHYFSALFKACQLRVLS